MVSGNETDSARPLLFSSYNAVSNEPIAAAQGPNEEGAFMNISAAERAYLPLKKLDDEVLRRRRFTSAFNDTRFKRPRLDLGGTFSPAVELDPPAEGPRKGST